MKLRKPTAAQCEAAERLGYSLCYASENGAWSIGTWPVLFGVRVIAWRQGSGGRCVDYCAGDDPVVAFALLAMLSAIFRQHLKEEATEAEVTRLLPAWARRPVNTDPACWDALKALADTTATEAAQ